MAQLPVYVAPFVETWLRDRERIRANAEGRRRFTNEVRGPIEQMLRLVVPGFTGSGRSRRTQEPFATQAPTFFAYLRQERGLRDETVLHYRHHLIRFEEYLHRIGLTGRGRDAGYPAPPAQIPACAANALGSCLGS